ncbi:microfibril-associated glycoprotein 4-like [Ruditapes philippinarum]|uniref:microfibril-associated glycoprotein 4-like n=1 Tax=Ruditapes philippinarum TaxID=129788 RepID=UPI00295BB8EE|nr:microfibril-associated glycoprotein 4-like [Ruditapes philippinarum]
MDLIIFCIVLTFGTVFSAPAGNLYIPILKLIPNDNTHLENELDNQCVTKEHINEIIGNLSNHSKDAIGSNYATKADIAELNRKLDNISEMIMKQINQMPIDCEDIQKEDYQTTGVYTIYPYGGPKGISVRCDMDTSIGGWTVIQRRVSDSNFYQNWDMYERGFGELDGNFWLGNRFIHLITSQAKYELRVDLVSSTGEMAYAEYKEFSVGDVLSGYRLYVDKFSGTAGDSLSYHNRMPFSTFDRDNDQDSINCAVVRHGAWWYKECLHSNLNGDYGNSKAYIGPIWYHWKGATDPMKNVEMKIRRVK